MSVRFAQIDARNRQVPERIPMSTLLLLNGPNLNLLGVREPELYGADSLSVVVGRLSAQAERAGHRLDHFQSNAEHELVERVQRARGAVAAIVVNPGAFGHTSLALADALAAAAVPYFEIHITNVLARGGPRARLLLAPGAAGLIIGCGVHGYELALAAAIARLA